MRRITPLSRRIPKNALLGPSDRGPSVGLAPSAVAAAAVTLALARSQDASLAHLREEVHRSLFGLEINADLQASIQRAEANLLASIQARAPPSRNGVRRAVPVAVPTAHLIPLEDD